MIFILYILHNSKYVNVYFNRYVADIVTLISLSPMLISESAGSDTVPVNPYSMHKSLRGWVIDSWTALIPQLCQVYYRFKERYCLLIGIGDSLT